jgi:hypothetical protein
MRFAYADPPYLGMCKSYDHDHGTDGRCWDDPETHRLLIERLSDEFPDGWALSLHVPSLRVLLPMTPTDTRTCAWVKPFASFKLNVRRAWTWEPILVRGGRDLPEGAETVRDYVSCGITLKRGFFGAKPDPVCFWLFRFLGMTADDEFAYLFHGSGAVKRAHDKWRNQMTLALGATA